MFNEIIVILEVGHNSGHPGAINENYKGELSEFTINKQIAANLIKKLWENNIKSIIVIQGSVNSKIKKINSLDFHDLFNIPKEKSLTKILVSLHFNAYKGYISNSSGCEVLVAKERLNSARLAELLLDQFSNLGNVNRGIVVRPIGSRGHDILAKAEVDYAVLCEPLFIDSEEGELLLDEGVIAFLIDSYYCGIQNFIKEVNNATS